MSIRNLDHLFMPVSVALIGASQRPGILKADYVRAFLEAVPELEHEEKAKSLDQRM